MTALNARSTQGVKIHTSASARRDDNSAIRTKMQPSGMSSFRSGGWRPSHTPRTATTEDGFGGRAVAEAVGDLDIIAGITGSSVVVDVEGDPDLAGALEHEVEAHPAN